MNKLLIIISIFMLLFLVGCDNLNETPYFSIESSFVVKQSDSENFYNIYTTIVNEGESGKVILTLLGQLEGENNFQVIVDKYGPVYIEAGGTYALGGGTLGTSFHDKNNTYNSYSRFKLNVFALINDKRTLQDSALYIPTDS